MWVALRTIGRSSRNFLMISHSILFVNSYFSEYHTLNIHIYRVTKERFFYLRFKARKRSECRDSAHYGVDPVKPGSSRCPPDICIGWFESLREKNKTERADALSVLLVRVSRFELEASWTPFKRDTKLRHTRIFSYTPQRQNIVA